MTEAEAPIPGEVQSGTTPLELLAGEDDVWTAVPMDASGDERVSEWLAVESDTLCDLEEWR